MAGDDGRVRGRDGSVWWWGAGPWPDEATAGYLGVDDPADAPRWDYDSLKIEQVASLAETPKRWRRWRAWRWPGFGGLRRK